MSDNVEHPSHYNAGSVETIDAIKSALGDAFLDYCRGNVIKYVWRCRHKGKLLEDLRKAAKYLEWAIAESESEKPSKPQPLAIPEGWRELEENEPLCEDDLFELDGEWVGHECDPSGGVYSSRIHCRHIRKIETDKPEHVEGVWVEEADANAKKIEPTEASDASLPDPGPGYRLLSKDPPERVIRGDEYLAFDNEWSESENWRHGSSPQTERFYYRRKIEPTEWIPKVGDKVRVVRGFMNPVGEVGIIKEFCQVVNGNFSILAHEGRCTLGWFKKDDVELIEASS